MRRRSAILAFILAGAAAWAYEPSLLSMTVPSKLDPGTIDLILQHRFYGSVLDDPIHNLFGLAIGANVGFGARYMILPGLQIRIGYDTHAEEVSAGAGYGYWFSDLPLGLQLDAEFVSAQETTARGYGVFTSLAVEAGPIAKLVWVNLIAGYDSWLNHVGVGLAARVDVIPSLALIAEFHPYFPESRDRHPEDMGATHSFAVGVMLTTYGHQFSLLAGNNFALGDRRLMAGAPAGGGIYLGFNIQRRFP